MPSDRDLAELEQITGNTTLSQDDNVAEPAQDLGVINDIEDTVDITRVPVQSNITNSPAPDPSDPTDDDIREIDLEEDDDNEDEDFDIDFEDDEDGEIDDLEESASKSGVDIIDLQTAIELEED